MAAEVALRRHAHRETAEHARRALALSANDDSPDGLRQELALQMLLGAALVTGGWAAPEAEKAYARALELRRRVPATPERFAELAGLYGFYVTRADLAASREIADDMLAIAATSDDTTTALDAHNAAASVAFFSGDFAAARGHFERVVAIYDPARHSPAVAPGYWGGQDVGALATAHLAWLLWVSGFPDQAAEHMREALLRAVAVEHPYTLAFAIHLAATFYQCRGEVDAVRELETLVPKNAAPARSGEDAERDGRPRVGIRIGMMATLDAARRGWLLCQEGDGEAGIEAMRSGIEIYRARGFGFGVPTLLGVLAEAFRALGRPRDGLAAIAQARELVARNGARYWDAELARIEGELALAVDGAAGTGASGPGGVGAAKAEAHFATALEIARKQGARLLELRAAVSLGCLLRARGEGAKARELVGERLGFFTEGFETRDLRAARALLVPPPSGPSRRRGSRAAQS
jgi:tetratricopeptide (TPR) repeat protein